MNKSVLLPVILLASLGILRAQDELQMKDGSVREGRLSGVEGELYRLSLPGPAPGQSGGTTTIPRDSVEKIVFGPDAVLDAIKANRTPASTAAARVRWQALLPFLAIPESRAAEAGNLYGEILLASGDKIRAEEALGIYRQIEEGAWNPSDREAARRGRLRTMLKLGRLEEISAEVEQIASTAQDPELLLDSKLLIAQSRLAALDKLLAENPRWYEDPPVRSERLRLIHETADNALYAFLFHGTEREQAARGLGLAFELYELSDNEEEARNVATDLAEIYPESPEAGKVADILKKKTDKS
jgi:hypothetical protein